MNRIAREGWRNSLFGMAGFATLLTGFGLPVMAAADEELILEEVVVTATKRSENLQDLAMSISALSGEGLEKMGATDFESYLPMLTGVSFTDNGAGVKKLSIRGVSADANTYVEKQSTVSVYIDEIPFTNADGFPDAQMFDVARVELLRGPQGTLYGAASLGGTLRIITNKANPDEYEGRVEATLATTRHGDPSYSGNGMINIPLSDTAALRLVGYYREDGGYVDQEQLGIDDWNDTQSQGLRANLFYQPSDVFTIDLTALYQDTTYDGNSQYQPELGDLIQRGPVQAVRTSEFKTLGLTMNYDLNFANLLSATSYNEAEADTIFDFSASAFNILGPLFGLTNAIGGSAPTSEDETRSPFYSWRTTESFTQEFRLTSQSDGPLEWIAGAYYSTEDQGLAQFVAMDGLADAIGPAMMFLQGAPPATWFTVGPALMKEGGALYVGEDGIFENDSVYEFDQQAIFAELTYNINDRLRVSAGGRFFKESYDLSGLSHGAQNLLVGAAGLENHAEVANEGSYSEDEFIPKLSVEYDVGDNTLLYALFTKGRRIGGANTAFVSLVGGPATYDSDELKNYEAGFKTSILDGRGTLNGTFYYLDYSDMQIALTLNAFPYFDNVGKATILGLELETAIALTEAFTLSAGVDIKDPKLSEDFLNPITGALMGAKGDQLIMAPKFSMNATLAYDTVLTDTMWLNAYLTYAYSDTSPLQFESGPNADPRLYIGGTHRMNVSVGVANQAGWTVSLFVTNLLDERARNRVSVIGDVERINTNRPRTFGIRTQYNF
jgi:outer membrane receptor protein involved in Fe transport